MKRTLAKFVQLCLFLTVSLPSSSTRQGPISENNPIMEEPPGPLDVSSVKRPTPEALWYANSPIDPDCNRVIGGIITTLKEP